ncbi:hypothetical protein MXAZACID_11514 [Acidocella sp. MX-AZ02]|nr:hypothetical protein MXAZACID_11514 [Acidocella sp. MX-AZ02]
MGRYEQVTPVSFRREDCALYGGGVGIAALSESFGEAGIGIGEGHERLLGAGAPGNKRWISRAAVQRRIFMRIWVENRKNGGYFS